MTNPNRPPVNPNQGQPPQPPNPNLSPSRNLLDGHWDPDKAAKRPTGAEIDALRKARAEIGQDIEGQDLSSTVADLASTTVTNDKGKRFQLYKAQENGNDTLNGGLLPVSKLVEDYYKTIQGLPDDVPHRKKFFTDYVATPLKHNQIDIDIDSYFDEFSVMLTKIEGATASTGKTRSEILEKIEQAVVDHRAIDRRLGAAVSSAHMSRRAWKKAQDSKGARNAAVRSGNKAKAAKITTGVVAAVALGSYAYGAMRTGDWSFATAFTETGVDIKDLLMSIGGDTNPANVFTDIDNPTVPEDGGSSGEGHTGGEPKSTPGLDWGEGSNPDDALTPEAESNGAEHKGGDSNTGEDDSLTPGESHMPEDTDHTDKGTTGNGEQGQNQDPQDGKPDQKPGPEIQPGAEITTGELGNYDGSTNEATGYLNGTAYNSVAVELMDAAGVDNLDQLRQQDPQFEQHFANLVNDVLAHNNISDATSLGSEATLNIPTELVTEHFPDLVVDTSGVADPTTQNEVVKTEGLEQYEVGDLSSDNHYQNGTLYEAAADQLTAYAADQGITIDAELWTELQADKGFRQAYHQFIEATLEHNNLDWNEAKQLAEGYSAEIPVSEMDKLLESQKDLLGGGGTAANIDTAKQAVLSASEQIQNLTGGVEIGFNDNEQAVLKKIAGQYPELDLNQIQEFKEWIFNEGATEQLYEGIESAPSPTHIANSGELYIPRAEASGNIYIDPRFVDNLLQLLAQFKENTAGSVPAGVS